MTFKKNFVIKIIFKGGKSQKGQPLPVSFYIMCFVLILVLLVTPMFFKIMANKLNKIDHGTDYLGSELIKMTELVLNMDNVIEIAVKDRLDDVSREEFINKLDSYANGKEFSKRLRAIGLKIYDLSNNITKAER
jgi:hypothetical protein